LNARRLSGPPPARPQGSGQAVGADALQQEIEPGFEARNPTVRKYEEVPTLDDDKSHFTRYSAHRT